MNRPYREYLRRLEEETNRIMERAKTDIAPALPRKPWDGVKNSELRGLMTPKPTATRQNEIARAALHTTTVDEIRTEGHSIKHRTNPHE